ncbi:MAG: LPS assembly lipoprotein LptE [Candidatus Latescibacterota bacterium]
MVGLLSGCAYYSTSAGAVGGIRSIAVPLSDNQTAEFGIGEELTERLVEAFTRDGRLRVVDAESADAVMHLSVQVIEDAPFTYTAQEVTEQYRFRLVAGARLVRAGDEEVLLALERLEGWGTYDAALPEAEGRSPATRRALDMVIAEIVDRTAAGW